MQMTINDLVFLREAGIHIDEETFASVLERENRNFNFTTCDGCCAITFQHHQPSCPHASILFEADWYERIQERS